MQIKTSVPKTHRLRVNAPVQATTLTDEGETPPVESENEPGFIKSVGRYGLQNGVRWGNGVGAVSGYLGGSVLASAGLYAGVVGGTAAGAAIGLGIAPAIAAVGSSGAVDFVKTTFSTTGFFAKTGMVLGTAALAVGAWEAGNTLGKAVGIPAGFVVGGPIGLAQGTWSKMQGHPTPTASDNGLPKVPKKVNDFDLNAFKGLSAVPVGALGALGAASGAVGGAVLGGAALSGATLVESLLAQNLTWSALSGPAALGAVVGGGVGLLLGARGGFKMGKGVSQLGSWAVDKLTKKPGVDTGEEGGELAEAGKNAAGSAFAFASKLSPYQVGFNVADTGMAAAHAFSENENVALMGNLMGGFHAVLTVGNLISATNGSTQYRCTKAAGHGLLAAGNFVGANGGGSWALPLMAAGMLVNTVNDYRKEN